MSDPKEYTIETLADISQIPQESLADFFIDLKSWLLLRNQVVKTNDLLGVEIMKPPSDIIWMDDGKHDMTIEIEKEESES